MLAAIQIGEARQAAGGGSGSGQRGPAGSGGGTRAAGGRTCELGQGERVAGWCVPECYMECA